MQENEDSKKNDSPKSNGEQSQDSPPTQNPDLPADESDLISKMMGDRIGETMFSERFLLSTLIKLTTLSTKLSEDEDFEKDLCTLWDMTIEKDVIRLLLQHNCLELFTGIIQITEDNRLVEILVGIIGNMCCLADTRQALICADNEIISTILNLISSTDSLTLVQLMRLLQSLQFENSGDEMQWFEHFKNVDDFVGKFAFILNNSMSCTLLTSALEALNGLLAKFAVIEFSNNDNSFRDIFVNSVLIAGVLEAFKQICPETNEDTDKCEDTATPTDKQQKMTNLFLDIHVILSQYENHSLKCYQPLMRHFLDAISRILTPLTQPIYLFPLSTNEQGVLENINDIFQTLNDPFDEKCFQKIIVIWSMIDKNREDEEREREAVAEAKVQKSEWDDDDDTTQDTNINADDIIMTLLEFLTRMSAHANQTGLESAFRGLWLANSKEVILKMHKIFSSSNSEPEIQAFSDKIKVACKNIWNVVILDDDTSPPEAEENRNV